MNRPTYLEINKTKFINNINKIKEYVGYKELMPVIKANGYGTYINKCIDIVNMFNIVAVARVDEAIELRNIGYNGEIFLLNQASILELDDIYKYDITIGISDITFIKSITNPVNCHLEIETGMNRTGVKVKDLDTVIDIINNNPNINICGIYTHFSSADDSSDYTNYQINNFREAYNKLKSIYNLKYVHCSASNGLMNYKIDFTNLVRPGLIMYGYETFTGSNNIIPVEAIATLKSQITFLKEVDEGEAISYSRRYITDSTRRIATIPIGYADGLRRSMTNTGYVLVNNTKCKIVGSVCMDSCMIDVTNVDCKVGDTVYIFDNKNITLEDIATIYNTINYEVLCTISDRIKRKFIEE
ncbi:MAG: alanine racemase [Bacilli bacterium]|nr:alanine racemase [Bacilli bacterium]